MSQQNENQNQSQQDNNKEAKKFEAAMRKLVALLGGEGVLKKAKVEKGDLGILMEKLTKKRKDALFEEFETKALALIDKKQAFDRFCNQKKQEMEKAILDEKKKMTKEMNDLFSIVDKMEQIQKDYYNTLLDAAGGTQEGELLPPDEEGTEEVQS